MPTENVDRLPADAIPSRARVDIWVRCVHVALLLLVSPALLLVLIVGGLFLLVQAVSRGWKGALDQSRRGRTTPLPDLVPPRGLPGAAVRSPAAAKVDMSWVYRDRPA